MGYVFTTEKCLTVARTGTAGFVSFQADGCVAGDSAKLLLLKKAEATTELYLFLQTMLNQNRFKYSYGRKVTEEKYMRDVIDLPAQLDMHGQPVIDVAAGYHARGYLPDWQFMEDFISSLHHEPITTRNSGTTTSESALNPDEWQWFKLGGPDGLFEIRKGKRLTSDDQTEGETPYIGAIDSNNGVANMIGQAPIHKGNTISLSYNGSVGEAFYQPEAYWATDDVNALYLRPEHGTLSPALGLFVCTVLRHEKYRFSYGRKWTLDNMNTTKIKLPATSDGKPDWKFMEDYIKSLPYGDRVPGIKSDGQDGD